VTYVTYAGKIKEHRATIRTVNGEFKEEVNKYRAYQKELYNYQRAKKRIEAEQVHTYVCVCMCVCRHVCMYVALQLPARQEAHRG